MATKVINAELITVPKNSIKGNFTDSAGDPTDNIININQVVCNPGSTSVGLTGLLIPGPNQFLGNTGTSGLTAINLKAGNNVSISSTGNSITISVPTVTPVDNVPLGTVAWFAAPTAPEGWFICDGRTLQIAAPYTDLFNVIGTRFGGDGVNSFMLPDLLGKFIRGWSNGRQADYGRAFGTYQEDSFKSHTHTDSGHGHPNSTTTATLRTSQKQVTGGGHNYFAASEDDGTVSIATGYANLNSTGDIETRPKNVALLPCIKYALIQTISQNAVDTQTLLNLFTSLNNQFQSSKTTNGYQQLPGGIIMQWGFNNTGYASGDTAQTYTFPVPFPTACLNVSCTLSNPTQASTKGQCILEIINFNATTLNFYVDYGGAGVNNGIWGFYWFAIGY